MRKKIDILILFIVLITGTIAALNAIRIGDWVHFVRYQAPDDIITLADTASMNDVGKRLFYRYSPQLLSQDDINSRCGNYKLGCAEGRNIYILEYSNDREFNQSTVTAAHEMLHIAYSRLSDSDKNDVNILLDDELNKPTSKKVLEKVNNYPSDDYYSEAHSFVGTEIENIGLNLEEYYNKYFENREEIIDAYNSSPIGSF